MNLNKTAFPEIGVPYNPIDSKIVKESCPNMKGDLKKEYDSYVQSAQLTKKSFDYLSNGNATYDGVKFDLKYEDGVPQTYKFLGMDIDSEFRAVIPFGDGYVVVEDMFNRDKIISNATNTNRFNVEDLRSAREYIKNCSNSVPRKLVTAMKAGLLYDIYKEIKDSGSNDINVTHVKKFADIIGNCMNEVSDDGTPLTYSSILLNLVHESNRNKEEILNAGRGDETSMGVTGIIVYMLFDFWVSVVGGYNSTYTALSCIDLWQSVYKKLIGEDEFNRRLKGCYDIIREDTGEIVERVVAFSGVSRNGDTHDANVFRSSASSSLDSIKGLLNGNSYRVDLDTINDVLVSEVQTENFDNPFDLTIEELQAMSSYDCLQGVDEDASVCMESYNMDDPEERAMFLRSAVKSYERNFKEYKPRSDYEVTEAMAEMIERGDRFKDRIVSDNEYDGEDTSVYVVTSSNDELAINVNKRTLLKVSKLVNKQLTEIEKLF